MAASTSKLDFILSLVDRMSGPAGKAMQAMDKLTNRAKSGYEKIGYGVAGMVGAAMSVQAIVQPAREMNVALGEVRSLGVGADVLDKLNSTALKFSVDYGESASQFVSSAYDIQGAIAGLTGDELPAFTQAGALLAKGTKANVTDITSYIGTMYGVFQKQADAMGKSDWVNMLAAQTAMAVNVFKTDGKGMSDAFTNLGANATTAGIRMSEQMAVLGTLQATMPGSEAGTKYRAFLDGVGKAQKELGLKFVDSQGKLLPMVDVLNRIKGKYGEIDTVAESDALTKAFGTQEAVGLIKLLSTDIDGLNKNIGAIGEQTGLADLQKMADSMIDPFSKVSSGITAVSIAFGQKLIPVLLPGMDRIVAIEHKLLRWIDLFPHLTRAIGVGVLAVLALIAVVSALSIVVGIGKFMLVGWQAGMMLVRGAAWLVMAPLRLMRVAWLAAHAAGMVWRAGVLLTQGAFMLLRFGILTALPALWGFAAALLANPVTWIVLGIVALGVGIAALAMNWDAASGAVWGFGAAVVDTASRWMESIGLFGMVDSIIAGWQALPAWWAGFVGTMAGYVGGILGAWEAMPAWWDGFIGGISAKFQAFVGAIASLNPFAGWSMPSLPGMPAAPAASGLPGPPAALGAPKPGGAPGGIAQQITRSLTNNNTRSIGAVNVHNYGQPMSGHRLAAEFHMAAP